VRQAFDKAATAGIARKGFKEMGIWPYNPLAFSTADFAPLLTSERPAPTANPRKAVGKQFGSNTTKVCIVISSITGSVKFWVTKPRLSHSQIANTTVCSVNATTSSVSLVRRRSR